MTASTLSEELVLRNCEYFADLGLWPKREKLDPVRWLGNFAPDHRIYGLYILNAFIFYNEELSDRLLTYSIRNSCVGLYAGAGTPLDQWKALQERIIYTYPEGEDPSITDSGIHYLRRAKKTLGIADDFLKVPDEALAIALRDKNTVLIFIDDFLGSGNQFSETWIRQRGALGSFATQAAASNLCERTLYAPLFATAKGIERLQTDLKPCPKIRPGHRFSEKDSIFSAESRVWPEHMRAEAQRQVTEISRAFKIPEIDLWGFENLGLAFATHDSVPDATIPLIAGHKASPLNPLLRI